MNVFDFAMKMELDGRAYYEKLVEGTAVPGLKAIFTLLAVEEQRHYDFFAALKKGIPEVSLGESEVLDQARNIFEAMVSGKEFKNRAVTSNEFDLEGYRHAMKLEAESVTLYENMAEKETSEHTKELLLHLANEEKKHYNIFENIYDFALKPHYFLQWREFTNMDEML